MKHKYDLEPEHLLLSIMSFVMVYCSCNVANVVVVVNDMDIVCA